MGLFRTARSLALIPLLAAMSAVSAADLTPGLIGEYFAMKGNVGDFPKVDGVKPTLVRVDQMVNFDEVRGEFHKSKIASNLFVRWSGVVKIATAGKYTFATESDDGSRLSIDGKPVVNNGGPHGMVKNSGVVGLTAGDHAVAIDYFQGIGEFGDRARFPLPAIVLLDLKLPQVMGRRNDR